MKTANKNKQVREQYGSDSHSPLSMGSDNVSKNPQDYDLVRVLQRQITQLTQEIRKLHNRHRELYAEIERLKSRQ
jgi:hypothetical protein